MLNTIKAIQKCTLIFLLCSIAMHSSAVIVTESQKIKNNKNYPKEMLILEFMKSRFFVPCLFASVTSITEIYHAFKGNRENPVSLGSCVFLLAMSRVLGICTYELYKEERDIYTRNECYKLMHPKSKIFISTELFEALYNNRAKAKSWFFTTEHYSRLDEYYSVFQELGLSNEITEQILLYANIISSDKNAPLKKTFVKTKQFIKLLKYATLKPWTKRARIVFYQKSKKKYFIEKEDKPLLKELYKSMSHFYGLKNKGWIHQNVVKKKQQLLFDSRYIDTEKEIDGQKINSAYSSEFGFRFYEVVNSNEQGPSLIDFYKFNQDPTFIQKVRKELKRVKIIPGCSNPRQNPHLIFGLNSKTCLNSDRRLK